MTKLIKGLGRGPWLSLSKKLLPGYHFIHTILTPQLILNDKLTDKSTYSTKWYRLINLHSLPVGQWKAMNLSRDLMYADNFSNTIINVGRLCTWFRSLSVIWYVLCSHSGVLWRVCCSYGLHHAEPARHCTSSSCRSHRCSWRSTHRHVSSRSILSLG